MSIRSAAEPSPAAPAIGLERLRWERLPEVLALETELFGGEAWSEALLWSELGRPETRHYLAAIEEGTLVGYGGLCAYDDAGFIQTMAVRPDRSGRGLGGRLLGALLTEAERRGCREVMLEVRVDNSRAQSLYRRFGFAEIGVRRGYYQPSGTDALVMRRPVGAPV